MIAQITPLYIKTRFWKVWPRLIAYLFFEGRPLTTQGRWFNPIVFFILFLFKKLPPFSKVIKPIFIVGIGRSGTTVLGNVLSMHKQIGYLNEPKALWHCIHEEEDLVGNYSSGLARYRLSKEDATFHQVKMAHRLFGAYLGLSFSSRLVDKYPELIFRVDFIKEIFPDAKFLFLVRNGWDCCCSIQHWSKKFGISNGEENYNWWGDNHRKWKNLVEQLVSEHLDLSMYQKEMSLWRNHRDMAAVEWVLSMREGLKLVKEHPNNILKVNYEDLCNEPGYELKKITNFFELDNKDQKFIEYATKTFHHAKAHEKFALNPIILKPFLSVMKELGYPHEF